MMYAKFITYLLKTTNDLEGAYEPMDNAELSRPLEQCLPDFF